MDHPSIRKLLSIVTGVRNDHYVANYSWRVQTIINYIAYGLETIGRLDDVEIVVADWNSPTRMVDELDLSEPARKITQFFDVPKEVAVAAAPGNPYPVSIVFNCAVRRATGEYIFLTDNDCLFTPATLDTLCRLLDGSLKVGVDFSKAIGPIARRKVCQELTFCCPSVAEINSYLNRYANLLDEDRIFNGTVGMAGAFMMHRDLWDQCGGIDESALLWGWTDIDFTLRNNLRYPWINLSNFGICVYHMEHPLTYVKSEANRKKKNLKVNVHELPYPFKIHLNGENWGNGQYNWPTYQSGPDSGLGLSKPPESSQDWRLEKLKGYSRTQVMQELVAPETRKNVAEILANISKSFPNNTPGVRYVIKQLQSGNASVGPNDWDVFAVIAWYCRKFFPLTYIEAGIGSGLRAVLAAGVYPPVSIYAFESWNPFENPLACHPLMFGNLLSFAKHQGYLRIIADQSAQAYASFWDNAASPASADVIVYVNAHPLDRVLSESADLLAHLAQAGLFVFQHYDRAVFERAIAGLQAKWPGYAWYVNRQTAFAIHTASLPGWTQQAAKTEKAKGVAVGFSTVMSVKEVTQKVESHLKEGREDEAVALISLQLQMKEKSADLHSLMGRVLYNLSMGRNARYYFERSIELAPEDLANYANLVLAMAMVGDMVSAEKVLRSYLQKVSDNPIMTRLMGEVLGAQDKHTEAISYYIRAAQLNPQDGNIYHGILVSAEETGDLVLAIEAIKSARALGMDTPDLEKKWNTINQRFGAASDLAQKILSSKNIAATVEQNWAALTPDVVYVLQWNAGKARGGGNEGLAQSYEQIAGILKHMLDTARR